jgi:hypothetical protein
MTSKIQLRSLVDHKLVDYDRILRDRDDAYEIIRYILENPTHGRLPEAQRKFRSSEEVKLPEIPLRCRAALYAPPDLEVDR